MGENWVRDRVVTALKKGNNVEEQADAVMALLEETVSAQDTYHLFVCYLNDLRLKEPEIVVEEEEGDG